MAEVYHLLNRGVDKRKIFLDEQDHFRFIHDLYEFNDEEWANNGTYFFKKYKDIGHPYIQERQPRKLIVDIHSFSLMPNHYHLMVSPRVENGISLFMKKLNGGYAKYFNEKYERSGALFQGKYKSVHIIAESHFIHLPYYIHCNSLDLLGINWRNRNIKNYKEAIKFVELYRWSSHLDYLGKKNFPSVISKNFLNEYFDGEIGYKNSINNWLRNLDIEQVSSVALET